MLKYGICLGESSAKDSSDDLSAAMWQLTGDGVCPVGSRFQAVAEGMGLTVGSGYALAAGRALGSDEPVELAASPGWAHADRQDIAAVQVDMKERRVRLAVLEGADPENLPSEPYTVPLYLLRVKRGATNLLPEDITDMRTYVPALSSLTKDGLRSYDFTSGGIDREIDKVLDYGEQVMEKAAKAVHELGAYIEQSGAGAGVGELSTGLVSPGAGWLLCNGGYIPAEYKELRAMLGAYLPNIAHVDSRYSTWIYGGAHD